jgi:hypothetical protein
MRLIVDYVGLISEFYFGYGLLLLRTRMMRWRCVGPIDFLIVLGDGIFPTSFAPVFDVFERVAMGARHLGFCVMVDMGIGNGELLCGRSGGGGGWCWEEFDGVTGLLKVFVGGSVGWWS